jgi:hypothetical protein
MIKSAIGAGPFQGGQIARLFHNANNRGVAPGIGADVAQLVLGQLATLPTLADTILDSAKRIRQGVDLGTRSGQEMMRQPFGRLGSDAGQFA